MEAGSASLVDFDQRQRVVMCWQKASGLAYSWLRWRPATASRFFACSATDAARLKGVTKPSSLTSILTFIHSCEPGGVERIALRLCAEWHTIGLEVTLAIGRIQGRLFPEIPPVNVLSTTRYLWLKSKLETLWMILWLPFVVRRVQPDIIFCPGNTYSVVAVALKILLGRKCPPIVCKVSNDLTRPDMIVTVRQLYHIWCHIQVLFINRFVALSSAMYNEIFSVMKVDKSRISVIYDPILTMRQRYELSLISSQREHQSRCNRLLFIGRLVKQKNLTLLINAFCAFAGESDTLEIVGDGPLRDKLLQHINTSGKKSQISITEHVNDIIPVLKRSDVLILSSSYEGVPAVIIEAGVAGLKIISTDCCISMPGLMKCLNGILVAPSQVALASAMAQARVLGQMQSRFASELYDNHDSTASALRYLQLFTDTLLNPKPGYKTAVPVCAF